MSLRIYIASHSQVKAAGLKRDLENHGFEIVSSWITDDKDFGSAHNAAENVKCRIAAEDWDDLARANVLVLLARDDGEDYQIRGGKSHFGGRFVEAGVAFGAGKRVIVLGRRENVPLHFPGIVQLHDIAELACYLKSLKKAV